MDKERQIINGLINSCVSLNAKEFIPFLLEKNVQVAFPNKTRFYLYLKMLINCAEKNCIGNLHPIEERPSEISFTGGHKLCFYDEGHKYALINLEYKIENNTVFLDVHPF